MTEATDYFSVEERAKATLKVLGEVGLLGRIPKAMRRPLRSPVMSEFVEFVGRNELAADLGSLDATARALRDDIDRYLRRFRDAPVQEGDDEA